MYCQSLHFQVKMIKIEMLLIIVQVQERMQNILLREGVFEEDFRRMVYYYFQR